jgi:hypothetical protein
MKITLTQILGLGVIGLIGYIFYDKRKQTPNQQPTEVEPEVTGGGGGGVFGGGFFPPPAPAPVPAPAPPTTTPTTTTKYTATKTNTASKFMVQNNKTQSADPNKISRIRLAPDTPEMCPMGTKWNSITKSCEKTSLGGAPSGFATALFSGSKCLTLDNLLD